MVAVDHSLVLYRCGFLANSGHRRAFLPSLRFLCGPQRHCDLCVSFFPPFLASYVEFRFNGPIIPRCGTRETQSAGALVDYNARWRSELLAWFLKLKTDFEARRDILFNSHDKHKNTQEKDNYGDIQNRRIANLGFY